jgi:ubiquinone/menaquinone biosynthesis C-methylase UbiE
MTDSISEARNLAEIQRSASEASKIVLKPIPRSQIDRYMDPPADTPYGLEYAFHLLGDVRGKTVLDLGCGTGENVILLLARGARVIGIDISPDLIDLAQRRIDESKVTASLATGDAYNTGLPDESVDAIFCMALIHHLDIKKARQEMWRILRPGGVVILREPIRFSRVYNWMRGLLPAREDISDYEHPLTRDELSIMTETFRVEGTRFFRLPLVPFVSKVFPSKSDSAWKWSNWLINHVPFAARYASGVVCKLQK